MKLRTIVVSSLLLAAGALGARAAFQEGMPMAKPGPEHAVLTGMVGTWDAVVEVMGQKETGSMTVELGPGGLWTISNYTGKMMGGAFLGHEVFGWDPAKKKYVSCWVDSTSAAMVIGEGTWDPATKTMTMSSESSEGAGGKMTNKIKVTDADHHTFEMYMGGGEGTPMMTINYTRKK